MNEAYRRLMVWGLVIILLVAVGAIFSKLYYDITLEGSNPFQRVSPVAHGGVMRLQTTQAQLEAAQRAELSFPVSGQVQAVFVTPGETVAAGQVLAQLSDARYQLAVMKARQNLAAAELGGMRAQVEQARLELAAAEADLAATTLKAPFAGRVMDVPVIAGQTVTPGTVALVLAQVDPPMVRAFVSQNALRHIAPGLSARVTLDAYPGMTWQGRVTKVGSEAVKTAGGVAVEVWIQLARSAGTGDKPVYLLPGLAAQAEVHVPRRQGTLDIANWFIAFLFVAMLVATYLLSKILTPDIDPEQEKAANEAPGGRGGFGMGRGFGGGRW